MTFCGLPRRGIVQLVGRLTPSRRRDAHHTLPDGADRRLYIFGSEVLGDLGLIVLNAVELTHIIELEVANGGGPTC